MSAHLVRSLLQRPILFNRALVDILDGSIYAALFLGQAIYWSERCDESGWFYKKAEEWEEETALSVKQQAGARTILRAKGYLSEKQDGGTDRKLFYSVNLIKLAADLQAAATLKSLKRSLPTCLNGDLEVPKASSCIDTETTAESTTEKKARGRDGRLAADIDGFEEFWALYPRRTAKAAALRAWAAAKRKRVLPPLAAVLASLRKQIDKNDWRGCEARFVPHASTWLNQERWADEVEAPQPERRVLNPLSSADLAALDLKRAISDAESEIKLIAPASDGWLTSTRTVFFDGLDACKSEAEVADHLARCRAVCDRLRALGAFPLRRPTSPGEILPAGGGAAMAVDLATGAIVGSGDNEPDLAPSHCPRCGRPAHFRYTSAEEAAKQSSFCWGESTAECDRLAAGRVTVESAVGASQSSCACGSSFPWHLAAVGLTAHVCQCSRRYRVVGGQFVPDGAEFGPFAEVAAELAKEVEDSERVTCSHGVPFRYPCEECDEPWDDADVENALRFCDESFGDGIPVDPEEQKLRDYAADSRPILEGPDRYLVKIDPHPYTYGLGNERCARCGQRKDAEVHHNVLAINATSDNASTPPVGFEALFSPNSQPRQLYPGHPDWERYQAEMRKRAEPILAAAVARIEESGRLPVHEMTDEQVIEKMIAKRAKIAEGQHKYQENALSEKCVWCGMPRDHIRHYLPAELPFGKKG